MRSTRPCTFFGVILFLGHNTVSLMWAIAASRTENPTIVRFSIRVFTWGDVFFTAFGLFLILVNGVMLSSLYGGVYEQSWILGTLIILGVSGLPLVVILPHQLKCWRLAVEGGSDADLMMQTKHRPALNYAMSIVVLLLYSGAFLMMTTKTGLW